jgi:hypothetical protein
LWPIVSELPSWQNVRYVRHDLAVARKNNYLRCIEPCRNEKPSRGLRQVGRTSPQRGAIWPSTLLATCSQLDGYEHKGSVLKGPFTLEARDSTATEMLPSGASATPGRGVSRTTGLDTNRSASTPAVSSWQTKGTTRARSSSTWVTGTSRTPSAIRSWPPTASKHSGKTNDSREID